MSFLQKLMDPEVISSSNLGAVIGLMCLACTTYILAAEYIVLQRPPGDLLLFLRTRVLRQTMDEEQQHAVSRKSAQVSSKEELLQGPSDGSKSNIPLLWSGLSYHTKQKKKFVQTVVESEAWVERGSLTAVMVFLKIRSW